MNALVALLASCGIEAYLVADSHGVEEVAFACPCGGAARIYDGADGQLWFECGRCAPSPGTPQTPEQFRQRFGATERRPPPPDAPSPLRIVELRDFLADTTPPPPDIVEGIAKAGTVFSIFGPAESGKSHLGFDLALSVAAGRDWLGQFPCTTKGPSVYVEQERAAWLVRERLRLLVEGTPLPDDAAPVHIIPLQDLRLDTAEFQASFRKQILSLSPCIVIIDTAIAVAGSVNFLDPGQVRAWMKFWRSLALDMGGSICLICHTPKWLDKQPRLAALFGSEDFGAALDYALATSRIEHAATTFRVACVKNTWGTDRPDLTFSIEAGPEGGIVLVTGTGGVRSILLGSLTDSDWTPGAELTAEIEQAGYTGRSARDALHKLLKEGAVEARPDPANRRWKQWRIAAAEAHS